MKRTLPFGLALFAALAPAARAQTLPIEEKAKFERALEEKAESVLLRILGPNRYRVVVDATLDFTRIERFDVKGGAAQNKDQGAVFLWQSVGAEGTGRSELLPGIPVPEPVPDVGGTRSYERQNSVPAEFVKRLTVNLILDEKIPEDRANAIGKLVQDVLDIRPDRGDDFNLRTAPFAPAWKTIWHTPETASLLFKYGLIALMTLITLIVVAACFLKLAEAMDAMAQAQTTQMSLDTGAGAEGAGVEGGEKEGEKKEGEGGEEKPPEAFFNVRLEQVDTLVEILRRQDPENIALIAAHLKPEVKRAFLDRLPTEVYTLVLLSFGKIKFIDPDTVATVKEELERRLESAVGGHGKLLELIEQSDQREKRELLRLLEARDQELARLVRANVLLFEDLVYLEPREWSLVLSRVRMEDWGSALHESDQLIREAVQGQMMPRTWAILTQMMEVSRPTEQAAEEARERIVKAVEGLIEEGRAGNPVGRRPAEPIPAEVEPDAAAPPFVNS